MGSDTTVAPFNYAVKSDPKVAQPASDNSIYEVRADIFMVGGFNTNADGAANFQYDSESTASSSHACRDLTQDQRYEVPQTLI